MQSYCLHLLNRDGSTDCFDLGAFDDESQAASHAKAALHVSLCAVAGELWRLGERVGRIQRDSSRPRPSSQPYRIAS